MLFFQIALISAVLVVSASLVCYMRRAPNREEIEARAKAANRSRDYFQFRAKLNAEAQHRASYAPAGYYHPKNLTPEEAAWREKMRVGAEKWKEDRAEAMDRSIRQYIIGKVAGEFLWDAYSKYVK